MDAKRSVIFLDIDGCLLAEGGGVAKEYYESFAWLAEYIRRANIGECPQIRFCTGRNIPFVDAVALFMGRPDSSFVIVENGIAIYNPTTKNFELCPGITPEIKKIFKKILARKIPAILKRYSSLFHWPGNLLSITLTLKINSGLDLDLIRENLAKQDLKRLVMKRIVRVIRSKHSVSIVPAHVNKGTAVMFLAEKENIDLGASLGIGDGKADIPFLERMKFVGCPQNADGFCKSYIAGRKHSGRISPFSYAQGVVDVIKWFTQTE